MSTRRLQFLTSRDAQAFRTQHKAPCTDCPWARKSLKGWLGPNTITGWLHVARDYWHVIHCHTRKKFERRDHSAEHWECAGAAIYRANTKVMPYKEKPLLQLPANTAAVFASPQEFEHHHTTRCPR